LARVPGDLPCPASALSPMRDGDHRRRHERRFFDVSAAVLTIIV
jgi:hypothetical protein